MVLSSIHSLHMSPFWSEHLIVGWAKECWLMHALLCYGVGAEVIHVFICAT